MNSMLVKTDVWKDVNNLIYFNHFNKHWNQYIAWVFILYEAKYLYKNVVFKSSLSTDMPVRHILVDICYYLCAVFAANWQPH